MLQLFVRFRDGARHWLGKAEHMSHVGYFGAIILSGHDPSVIIFAGLCAVLILLALALGSE